MLDATKASDVIIGDARCMDLSQFGRYRVIIVDPPWPYDNPKGHEPRLGGYTYEPMTLEELGLMPVPKLALDDCILFLWSTNPKLPEALWLMQTWDFDYVTKFPWIKVTRKELFKPRYGIGHWVASCSEDILIGRRGKVSPPQPPLHLGLLSPIFKHSRKPDGLHDVAETLHGPYLELFARRPREGWTVFGNEIETLPLFGGVRP